MKLMTFAEINDLENGQQVSSFQGTIKKVFEQKTGVGDYGPWHLQNIILQDDHANELTVTWTCEDPWNPRDEGKQLLFESGFDKKDQLVGLKREIKKRGMKVYESVKVDDRAKVKTYEANPLDEKGEYEHLTERIKPDPDWPEAHSHPGFHVEAPVNAPESSPARSNGDSGVQEAREHLMKSANLYNLCVAAVDKAIAPNMPPVAQTSEQFQAAVASLFIEASREVWWSGQLVKHSLIEKMPQKPI